MTYAPEWISNHKNNLFHLNNEALIDRTHSDAYLEEMLSAPIGSRNNTLNKLAFNIFARGLSKNTSVQRQIDELKQVAKQVGLTEEEVDRTVYSAKTAAHQKALSITDTSEPSDRNTEKPIIASEYKWIDLAEIPKRDWLYGKYFIRKFISLTVAPGGVGKSSLLITEALSMVSGKPLLGQTIERPLNVWIWNLEDPLDELQRRIQACCHYFGLAKEDIENRLFLDSGRDQELCIAEQTKSGTEILVPVVDQIISEIQKKNIDVLIIDPFVSSHSVSENDNMAIDKVAKSWARIADIGNVAIGLVHHTRKENDRDPRTAESARGAKALVDKARDVRVLARMTQKEAETYHCENRNLYVSCHSDKLNLAPGGGSKDWYKLISVDSPSGDNIGVMTKWDPPSIKFTMDNDLIIKVLDEIGDNAYRENVQSSEWVGYIVAEALDLDIGRGLIRRSRNQQQLSQHSYVRKCLNYLISNGHLVEEERELENSRQLKKFIVAAQTNDQECLN